MITRRFLLAAVLAATFGIAGCTTAGSSPDLSRSVYDFQSTEEVSLATKLADDRPTLLWFWAPWCEVCNAEAETVAQMAAEGEGYEVVGVGGRDSVAEGQAFVDRHGLDAMSVVYDEPELVWQDFAIGPQPAAVLIDENGKELGRWQGPFEATHVEAALAKPAA